MNRLSKTIVAAAAFIALATLTTQASAVAPPYFEDFESEELCGVTCNTACPLGSSGWTNDTANDDIDWTVNTGTTSTTGTGPSSGFPNDGRYLYTEASTPCNGSMQEAHLISPPLELQNTTTPTAVFSYHMDGNDMGTMHVDVSTDGGANWTNDIIPSFTDNVDSWQQQTIDLTAYAGMTINLRIRGVMGSGFESDMAVDQFMLYDAVNPLVEVAIVSIDSITSGCGLSMTETVTVTIQNNGPVAQMNVPLELVVDGGAAVMETYMGTLAPFGGTDTYSFTATADLSAAGPHSVTVAHTIMGDVLPVNDSVTADALSAAVESTFPYREGFEAINPWTSGGPNNEWEQGFPFDLVIFGANSGVGAWKTDLNGDYPSNHDGWVTHACGFDMTNLTNPAIRLAIWYESEFSWDGARLESSIDGGSSWQPVGMLGDPVNWYNDGTIAGLPDAEDGWTGRNNSNNGSGRWILAAHPLTGLAGQANVNLRVRFGSDGSVQDEGFAIDDIYIFDDNDRVEVVSMGPAVSLAAQNPSALAVHVETLRLDAFGATPKNIDAITLTQSGSIADAEIADVRLFLDDGDGAFDNSSDTLLGNGTLTAGAVTMSTMGNLSIAPLDSGLLFVEVDLNTALASATIQFGVANPANDIVENGMATIMAINAPIQGPPAAVAGAVSTLPFLDDFSGSQPNRTTMVSSGGMYPTATMAGNMVGNSAATANDGELTVSQGTAYSVSGLITPVLPASAPGMAAFGFPNGSGTAALDYQFDLSALTAANDQVWFAFNWINIGAEDADENNVFISLDNGATWLASIYRFDVSSQGTWSRELFDLSALLVTEGADFTNQVMIRFQVADDNRLGFDGIAIDNVFVGNVQEIGVERPAMTDIPEDSTDDLGQIAVGPQSFTYTVRNDGDLPLNLGDITVANDANLANIVVGAPMENPVPPQSTTTVQIDFEIVAEGTIGFDVSIANDDPRLGDGTFDFSVTGEGIVPMADIDVQRPPGTSIASGGQDPQGTVNTGVSLSLTYTVENVGTGPLMVDTVSIANATNATASTTGGNVTLAPGETEVIQVDYTVDGAGDFSFDLVIANDDADEDPYTITVSGTGESQGTGGGGQGGSGQGGNGQGGNGQGGGGGSIDAGGGCGCSVPNQQNQAPLGLLLTSLLGLAALLRRRRRVQA